MKKLYIYDIDGTLTRPGNDLWYLTTQALALNKELFSAYIETWREEIENNTCFVTASHTMMLKGLKLMSIHISGSKIKEITEQMVTDIIKRKSYFPSAITHLNRSIERGNTIILSTTNYQEGGETFLSTLIEHGLLPRKKVHKNILVSGTTINWKEKSIEHFNMAEHKVTGICNILNLSHNELCAKVKASFGDDPLGNDRGILSLTRNAYVIENEKNKNCPLPENMRRTTWDLILKDYL